MNKIGRALRELYEAEEELADEYVKVGERLAAEHEVWYGCKRFAQQCHLHAETIRAFASRRGHADLFLCEATLEEGVLDGEPRGHLSAEEAIEAFEASGAKRLLVTHRPDELPLADGLERAYDGLELDV